MSSYTFSDSPVAAVQIVRLLYAVTSNSPNATDHDDGGIETTTSVDGNNNTANSHDSTVRLSSEAQQVAFMLWSVFLIICFVLPACCYAYRRRQLLEVHIVHQQAALFRLHQQGVFYWHQFDRNPADDMNSESVKDERTRRVTEELQTTTFTVEAKDISSRKVENDLTLGEKGSDQGSEETNETTDLDVDEELGGVVMKDDDAMENKILTLPLKASKVGTAGIRRTVPGGCAICLSPYAEGESVTWARRDSCRHCFHTNCVITWLARQDETKCPLCRQYFCFIDPVLGTEQMNQRQASSAHSGWPPRNFVPRLPSQTSVIPGIRNHSSLTTASADSTVISQPGLVSSEGIIDAVPQIDLSHPGMISTNCDGRSVEGVMLQGEDQGEQESSSSQIQGEITEVEADDALEDGEEEREENDTKEASINELGLSERYEESTATP